MKITQQAFLEKCKESAHKNIDYSKAIYKGRKTPVRLSCKLHPDQVFYMRPDVLYYGYHKCVLCTGRATTHEQFLTKCKMLANPNLNFSTAIFQGSTIDVKLSCKIHKDQVFYMSPDVIYQGQTACAKCGHSKHKKVSNKTLSQQDFLEKCRNSAHKNLDLSQAVYKNVKTKVKLSCKIHKQVFYMRVDHVYKGEISCGRCKIENRKKKPQHQILSQKEFLDKCKNAYPNLNLTNAIYTHNKSKIKVSCKLHPKQVFYMYPDTIYRGYSGCEECYNHIKSKPEQDLADFIKSVYNSKIVLNDRTILNGKELDIYLPDKQLAIEFNGVYWHSSARKKSSYHYEKFKSCKDKGIRLIQIWEDTWDNRKDTVKHFLRQELNSLPTVDVKDTIITADLDEKTVKAFLNKYHLEGYAKHNYAIALKHRQTKKLLAVMTFTKTANKGELLLSCFATKTPIVGAFSMLIDTAKGNCVKGLYRAKNSSKVRCFIAYTNNETDTGEVYKTNNWQRIETLPISYTYWHKSSTQRISKSTYSIHQFKANPELQHLKGLSLKQLEELNSLYRCYDTGKQKWQLDLVV